MKLECDSGIDCINVTNEETLKNNTEIKEAFSSYYVKIKHSEDGLELFVKITKRLMLRQKEKETQRGYF